MLFTPHQQPKCTIYHDLTGSTPERPWDGTRGLHRQEGQKRKSLEVEVHVMQVAAGKPATKNTVGKQILKVSVANWRKLSSSTKNAPRQDRQTTHRPQISAGIINRPTWSEGTVFSLNLPVFVPDTL